MRSIALGSVLSACLSLSAYSDEVTERNFRSELDFGGRYLVSVSDADMVASAYVDGMLGPREGKDMLSVVELTADPRNWQAIEVPTSNSVAGPPNSVTISPDGRFALVVETFKPRPDNDDTHVFSDLQFGDKLLVYDLSVPNKPKLLGEHKIPKRPEAVSFNASGDLVAVSFHPAGGGTENPLGLFSFKDGNLGSGAFPEIEGWQAGDRLIDIAFHPTDNILAGVEISGGATLRFLKISNKGDAEVIGNVVDIERFPLRVLWSPDGRHAIVNATYWGPDIAGTWIEAPRGSIATVKMNAETRDDGSVRHALVSRIQTGVSPEGLAVAPTGDWIVTTNLERSYLPYDDDRITWFSSLTLAKFDRTSGQLTNVGTFSYDGILPEAAVFDNSGEFLAVATYDHFDDSKQGGSIDIWRIQSDPLDRANVQLIKTEHAVPVTRGIHSMAIVR